MEEDKTQLSIDEGQPSLPDTGIQEQIKLDVAGPETLDSLMELLATGEPDLTQQDVQACKDTLARTLDFIKNGGHVSKNMVNGDSLLMVSPLDSSLVGSSSEK